MKPIRFSSATLAVVLSFNTPFSQAESALSQQFPETFSHISEIVLPELDNAELIQKNNLAIRKASDDRPAPLKFAEPQTTTIQPNAQWQSLVIDQENGEAVEYSIWQTKVTSPGALSLNLGFTDFYLPEGASLYIFDSNDDLAFAPLTAADNDDHGQYWSPMISGDSITLELNVPAELQDQVKLNLSKVNHGYLGSDIDSILESEVILKSGSCNVDVACSQSQGWEAQVNATARITIGGASLCSGAAINNANNDGKAYFLTAEHCTSGNASSAPTIVAYWKYENPTCRTPGSSASGTPYRNLDNALTNSGGKMLAVYEPSDMYLMEFDDPFPEAANVYLAGWSRSSEAPPSAVSIHHPKGHAKRISHENDPLGKTSTHLRVNDWDSGTTEGGSSGSPLFDNNKRIVGQLTGGGAACGNDEYDIYGHMAVNWAGGGSSASRAKDWLDPNSTGVVAIDGRYANNVSPTPTATPAPTATPTPVVTPAPTETPIPTATPDPDDDLFGGAMGSYGLLVAIGLLLLGQRRKRNMK